MLRPFKPLMLALALFSASSQDTSAPQVTLDGQPANGGVTAVVGMIREIGAPTPQTIGDSTFTFKSWSDGGAPIHEITVPSVPTTYTARFQRSKVRGQREP